VLLRRYLEKMEELDLEEGLEPRVRLFTRHRVVNTPEGFVTHPDGRIGFRVETLQELDYKGKFVRIRRPGSAVIDVGVPELFMIAQGFHSTDAERLGFKQEDVAVDHNDGRGAVVAQADFLAGLVEALVGGRLRRRISSEFDEQGQEYWARQIAVGHENDPEVGWCLVQVPDFKSFDPIKSGILPEGTDPKSPEYFAAYDTMVYDFYAQHVGDILEMPKEEVKKIQMVYGPKLFTLIERMGTDALLAPNGVVGGDSFGNGHFLTSGGAMTGMIGHSWRVYEYFRARDSGVPHEQAIRSLADRIKEDTTSWLHVSAREYGEAIPINFGADRIAQIESRSGISSNARAAAIDASRRQRQSLIPLDPSDWRRLFLRNGRVYSAPLPELHAMHPALRSQQSRKKGPRLSVAFVTPDLLPGSLRYIEGVLGRPGVTLGLVTQGAIEELPQDLRERIAAHATIADVGDAEQIAQAVRGMKELLGQPERLLSPSDDLQIPLAEARARLGLSGMSPVAARDFRDTSGMREKLAGAGLPIARYARIESLQDGMAFGTEIGYYPLVVKPHEGASVQNTYRVDTEEALRTLLERLQPTEERPLICEELIAGRECTLEVVSIGGVPAWFSATRFAPALLDVTHALTITLPREADDPADPLLRRMGFAALKALGMDTGFSSMRWFRRPDGSPIIAHVSPNPPAWPVLSLMGLAHDVDMHRVWANTVVNGLFAPIPRLYAAGAVSFPEMRNVEDSVRELGDIVAEVHPPQAAGSKPHVRGSDGFVLVRHPETAVVEKALEHIAGAVGA
jgi:hypothetical protein